jgi:hypothetical protein
MIEGEGVRRFLLHGNELKIVMTVIPDLTGPFETIEVRGGESSREAIPTGAVGSWKSK